MFRKSTFLGAALVLLALSSSACAPTWGPVHARDRRDYDDRAYVRDVGYRNGYQDGLEKGDSDWRRHRSYDVLRHDWYRDGDRHYKREYGPRDLYRDAYRSGFKQGYDSAFGRRY
jgi:hypothetical protein